MMLTDLTLAAELCPSNRRSTLQAVLSFCNVWAFLIATFLTLHDLIIINIKHIRPVTLKIIIITI